MEKYTNIDYLEYELDMYNLKDSQRRAKQEKVIEKLKDQHLKNQKDEIFEDDAEDAQQDAKFNEMRETKTGFGAKGQYHAEGALEPEDEESDDDEEGDEDADIGDDPDDDEDDESDHNF